MSDNIEKSSEIDEQITQAEVKDTQAAESTETKATDTQVAESTETKATDTQVTESTETKATDTQVTEVQEAETQSTQTMQGIVGVDGIGAQGSAGDLNKNMLFAGIVIAVLLIAAAVFMMLKRKENVITEQEDDSEQKDVNSVKPNEVQKWTSQSSQKIEIGKVHHIGKRKSQQDSLGVTDITDGVLAVVADGMGGLADGDKVSQKIVMTALGDAEKIASVGTENPLFAIAAHANREVNRMLGINKQYKSGSTMLAVAADKEGFHWLSIGDSRIYLYRSGKLLQLNREHIYETELMCEAVNGEISFAEVKSHSQRKGLTSFIGMGELKHVDGSMRKLSIQKGDMVLLMSDGIYNTISDTEIEEILARAENAKAAESVLEQKVLEKQNPKQDNFTAVMIGF